MQTWNNGGNKIKINMKQKRKKYIGKVIFDYFINWIMAWLNLIESIITILTLGSVILGWTLRFFIKISISKFYQTLIDKEAKLNRNKEIK